MKLLKNSNSYKKLFQSTFTSDISAQSLKYIFKILYQQKFLQKSNFLSKTLLQIVRNKIKKVNNLFQNVFRKH